jgi:hypothetical protein
MYNKINTIKTIIGGIHHKKQIKHMHVGFEVVTVVTMKDSLLCRNTM